MSRLWPRKNDPDQIAQRQEALRSLPHWRPEHDHIFDWPVPPEKLIKAQECLTAHMLIPVGVVGPLVLNLGDYALDPDNGAVVERDRYDDTVFVPLAHTEGGLSASMLRGLSAAAAGGGMRTYVLADRITRDSCFVFDTTGDAVALARWIAGQVPEMQRWLTDPNNPLHQEELGGVARLSRHARLWSVDTHVVGTACHVLYHWTTGDACGPNMMTRNSFALNHWFVMERFPAETGIRPLRFFLEANMGGDKKPSYLYYQHGGHGKTVLAEATVPTPVLRRVLRTSASDLRALEHAGLHGSHASGMQSFGFTPASAIAALFAATGQDLGMVGTSSMAHGALHIDDHGDAHFSIRLPGLEVATVGGGTGLPHARAFLQMMDCAGPGKVYRFAQIVAAATLALEISASASMATAGSANFYSAHLERGGLRDTQAR